MKKPWYRFGVKTIAFLVSVIIVDMIIGKSFDVLRDLDYKKNPQSRPSDYMVKSVESNVVIVGSSLASCHYIPAKIEDGIGLSTYNCGMDGTGFLVQNSLLNLMLDRYQPKVIVWEVGETSMESGDDFSDFQHLYPYYDSSKQVKDIVNHNNRIGGIKLLSKTYRHNSCMLDYLKGLLTSTSSLSKLELKGYLPLDTTGYVFPTKIHKAYGNTLDSYKTNLLEQTIARCKDSNVCLVIPSSPRYINNYDEIKATHSYQAITEIAKRYDVPILDFFNVFSNDSTMFKDNAHLNCRGAGHYMDVFVRELKRNIEDRIINIY